MGTYNPKTGVYTPFEHEAGQTTKLNWGAVRFRDFESWAPVDAQSCIGEQQALMTMRGTMTALEIYNAVKRGGRIDFATERLEGTGKTANPVIAALKTRGKGIRITFEDTSTVTLTSGHMLPTISIEDVEPFDVRDVTHFCVHAKNVKPGMVVGGKLVTAVMPLGKINAIRLWTYYPAWINTADNVSIGTRWHEVLAGWFTYTQHYDDVYGDGEMCESGYTVRQIHQILWVDSSERVMKGRRNSHMLPQSLVYKSVPIIRPGDTNLSGEYFDDIANETLPAYMSYYTFFKGALPIRASLERHKAMYPNSMSDTSPVNLVYGIELRPIDLPFLRVMAQGKEAVAVKKDNELVYLKLAA